MIQWRQALERASANAWLLLIVTMFIWGANAPVIRAATGEISPMTIVHLRWVLVAAAIWFFGPPTLREDWKAVRARPAYLLAMAAMMTASNAMIFTAANYTTAINLSILQGAGPILLIIGARIAHKTRITPVRAFGVLLSLAGVVLLAAGGDLASLKGLTFNIGDILMLSSVALYSVYILVLRQRPPVSYYSFFCFVALGSLVLSFPLFVWEIAAGLAIWPTWKGVAALVYVGLLTSMIGQLFFMRAVELIGPARAGISQNLPPVIGATLAVIFLGETLAPYHIASLALVIGGIWISERLGRA